MLPSTLKLKTKIARGERVFGSMLFENYWPGFVELMAGHGYDFLIVEIEHALASAHDLNELFRAARLADLPVIIRPPDTAYHLIANYLDSGAQGVLMPRVESPEQVRAICDAARMPPEGRRGAGGINYLLRPLEEEFGEANQNIIAIQIESGAAAEHADELFAAGPIDAVIIGPADLSISLGVPMQYTHPLVEQAIAHTIAACQRHGVAPGMHVDTPEIAARWFKAGMTFMSCSSQTEMFFEKSREVGGKMRALRDGG